MATQKLVLVGIKVEGFGEHGSFFFCGVLQKDSSGQFVLRVRMPFLRHDRTLSVYPEAPVSNSTPSYDGEIERPVGEGVRIRRSQRDTAQSAATDPVVVMLSFAGMRWHNFDKYTQSLYAMTSHGA